jgi:DtxR family Mn-dependent transcriptional regulator
MASISIEDFLKNVFSLINLGGKATTSKLAKRLRVSNAAITDMSRKLAQQGLINYEKYRAITLTPEGEKIALSVVRRHRLWELFLNKVLDVPWEKVHDEAEKLEHQTSDFLINEIDKYLGFPEVDPHGDPIPDESGNLQNQDLIRLTEVKLPSTLILRRIVEHTGETMQFLNDHQIELNMEIVFKSLLPEQNTVLIALNGTNLEIPVSVAEKLFVEKL